MILHHVQESTIDDPQYQEGMQAFQHKYGCNALPQELTDAWAAVRHGEDLMVLLALHVLSFACTSLCQHRFYRFRPY